MNYRSNLYNEKEISSNDIIHFIMLIDATADIAKELRSKYLSKKDYFILDCEVGIPLKSYIVLRKLKRAYMYLLENDDITDAALKSGFDSPSHFAYTSKKLTGMSAKNIRKDSVFLKVYNLEIE
ncbi:helix-turn-helix domain-containing protein [Clostridium tertium]|uniref:helix-turn-helix domain-containing protein n=1 Tax=Clostridium tertium TaxID=1559 RepID=UPI0018ABF483